MKMQTIASSYSFSPKTLRFKKKPKPIVLNKQNKKFLGNLSYSNKTLETIPLYRSGLSIDRDKKLKTSIKFFSNLKKKKHDPDFLATLYSSNNFENTEKDMSTKFNIYTHLSQKQKERIKLIFKNVPRNISITTNESQIGSSYSDPFNSQKVLNLNKDVYNAVSNIRIENQFESFNKKIEEINKKKKIIKLMPKIRISKLTTIPYLKSFYKINTSNSIIGTIRTDSKKNNKKPTITRLNSRKTSINKIPSINNINDINKIKDYNKKTISMIPREKLSTDLKCIFNIIHTQYHPSSRGLFSLITTEDGTIYIFGGYQSKSYSDLWKCYFKRKRNLSDFSQKEIELILKWEKVNILNNENPLPRYGHSIIYFQDNLYIYGGVINGNLYNVNESLCIFDITKNNFYYPDNIKNKIQPRKNHIGIGIGSTMLIHGGINNEGEFLNDLNIYDILKKKWFPLDYKNTLKIPKIAYHSCCLVIKNPSIKFNKGFHIYKYPEGTISKFKGNKPKIEGIYIFGGIEENGNFFNDLWLIRIGIKPVDILKIPFKSFSPCGRINCGITFFNPLNFLVIYGGRNEKCILNDIWVFDLENFIWIKPNYDQDNCRAVCEHCFFENGDKIFILGGYGNFGFEKFDFYTFEFDALQENDNKKVNSNSLFKN